ncbi:hypothetical protein HDU77_007635 [Chytriomyces hyalinus]|nr:hypothetical protein HDU77_007635 [Chytriomyces hyalinus]
MKHVVRRFHASNRILASNNVTQSGNFERTQATNHARHERKPSSFIDLKCVNAVSGAGGNGAIHFFKGLVNPIGPPCGGNGGRGGDVYVVASKEVTSLGGLLNRYRAVNGGGGDRQNKHGRDAPSMEIVVPVGTLVRQVDSLQEIALAKQMAMMPKEPEDAVPEQNAAPQTEDEVNPENEEVLTEEELEEIEAATLAEQTKKRELKKERQLEFIQQHFIFRKDYVPHADRIKLLRSRIPPRLPPQPTVHLDLSRDGERHLIVRGGRGGFGNPHFSSNEIKGPGIASRGEMGSSIWLELELKTIADVGLVGLPNAGKSTFLSKVTNATPKIASYPFTTLNPYVGTIEYSDNHTITIADIPGLVAGAHLNVGLGHEFLRHVERSTVLVYIIDLGALDCASDFRVLRNELERYQTGLTLKPSLVVANKADLGPIAKENLAALQKEVAACAVADGKELVVIPVSARDEKNVGVALSHLRRLVAQTKKNE